MAQHRSRVPNVARNNKLNRGKGKIFKNYIKKLLQIYITIFEKFLGEHAPDPREFFSFRELLQSNSVGKKCSSTTSKSKFGASQKI